MVEFVTDAVKKTLGTCWGTSGKHVRIKNPVYVTSMNVYKKQGVDPVPVEAPDM